MAVQAAAAKPVSAAVAAQAVVDPNSFRVVDTELHVEAERSYLAVRFHSLGMPTGHLHGQSSAVLPMLT